MGLSNEQKVLLVETAILEGSKDDILRVIKENTPFEFTARALAFACRYRDLEIVKILVENDFSFQYSYSPSIEKKYKVKYGTQTQTAPTDFSVLPIPDYFVHSYDDLFDHVYFPCIQRCLRLRDILETDYEKGIVKELKNRVSDEALTSVFLFLRDQLPYFNIQKVYYYAILSNIGLACMLKQKNVFLSEDQVTEISSYDQKTLEGLEYRNMLFASFLKGDLDKTAKIFCEEFAKYGKRYMLYKQLTEEVLKEGSPVLIKELLKLGCVSTFNKKEVVEYLLENRKEDSIIVLLDYKSIEVKYLEKYLDAIVDKKLTALNALLLEKKSKSIKKDELKNLTIKDITPAAVLKKTWSTKKTEDGNLQISSYKGVETDVIVPSQIGNGKVTIIGPEAFSPGIYPVRLSEQQMEARTNLHSVVISEGIESIEESAFRLCRKLEEIKLPDSMCLIGKLAFSECSGLEKIVIPKNVSSIQELAFSKCSGLKMIVIPRNVSFIGNKAFDNSFNFWDNTPIEGLTIYGEKGSYAEQYAKDNNIVFESMTFDTE